MLLLKLTPASGKTVVKEPLMGHSHLQEKDQYHLSYDPCGLSYLYQPFLIKIIKSPVKHFFSGFFYHFYLLFLWGSNSDITSESGARSGLYNIHRDGNIRS